MTAFSAAIDAIFADPNMAAEAVWRTQTAPQTAIPCRVILTRPDLQQTYGDARITSDTTMLDVRVSEVAAPQAGDRVTIGGEVLVIQGEPLRDRERLAWKCEAVPE
ncbi:hypothetical protein [Novosphingobium sp.]|uniref:head-tail joining protein n=1 Tax=Novosphingobium sp. TaxID=1874826 RepID=UPI00261F5730|nr:hypothetical protein [Novosphingobium sp.]